MRTAPVQAWHVTGEKLVRVPAGRIPWDVHVQAWTEYSRRFGQEQSAETIASRGGFGYREVQTFLAGYRGWPPNSMEFPPVPGWEPNEASAGELRMRAPVVTWVAPEAGEVT